MSLRTLSSALDTGLALLARGFSVVPVPRGKKAPVLKGWQKLRLSPAELTERLDAHDNLCIILGTSSGDLVDVDLDSAEALQAAQELLPPTEMSHGRVSKPESHWWYRTTPCATTMRFADITGAMLVELRSTGGQTIVPPSVHPSGEVLDWHRDDSPALVSREQLREAVADVAACALLARHWAGEGVRQEAALASAGLFLRYWPQQRVKHVVGLAARIAGDSEWARRAEAVDHTAGKAGTGFAVTGVERQ